MDEPLAFEGYAGSTTAGTGSEYALFADRQGSVLAVVDPVTGAIAAEYTYDAFGQITQTGALQQPFGFTGREFDAESGLYYYRARYYDPALGMFIQSDPIGFAAGDLNIYAYVENDPFNWTDPSGLASDGDVLTAGIVATTRSTMGIIGRGLMGAALDISSMIRAASLIGILSMTGDDDTPPGDPLPGGNNHNYPEPPEDPKMSTILKALVAIGALVTLEGDDSGGTYFEIEGSSGTLDLYGQFSMEGTHLTVDSTAIFSGGGAGSTGYTDLMRMAQRLGRELGATKITIRGDRISGANPGRPVEITIPVR